MSNKLSALERARLAKLCGLFGSDHAGERANAAAMADRLVRDKGLTWPDVIGTETDPGIEAAAQAQAETAAGSTTSHVIMARELLRCWGHHLNSWELGFLHSIQTFSRLSEPQWAKLWQIEAKFSSAQRSAA